MQQNLHPYRIVGVAVDGYGNGLLMYGDGRREAFGNFVLDAPPEVFGAGDDLSESTLLELAIAGALPAVQITADAQGRWPGAPGPLLDAWRYRKVVAAWWRRRRPARAAQKRMQRSRGLPTQREEVKTHQRPSPRL